MSHEYPIRLQDYHMHTSFTENGKMNEFEACDRAAKLGFQEIAFTNHIRLAHPENYMSPSSLIRHWENIQECMKIFPQLIIRLGLEVDYYPKREAEIKDLIVKYESLIARRFDIVLGAVHEIRGGLFSKKIEAVDFFKNNDLLSTYEEFFELEIQAIHSGLFDIMAHPDLIKKYTGQLTPFVPFDEYKNSIKAFISALISTGVGIEINTKGLKLPFCETYPSMEILQLYLSTAMESGVKPCITIGSDAHKLDDFGYGIPQVIESLRNLGVQEIMSFDHRNKIPIGILANHSDLHTPS